MTLLCLDVRGLGQSPAGGEEDQAVVLRMWVRRKDADMLSPYPRVAAILHDGLPTERGDKQDLCLIRGRVGGEDKGRVVANLPVVQTIMVLEKENRPRRHDRRGGIAIAQVAGDLVATVSSCRRCLGRSCCLDGHVDAVL